MKEHGPASWGHPTLFCPREIHSEGWVIMAAEADPLPGLTF